MPLYEYHCLDCEKTFEMLRPLSKATAPATCPVCGNPETSRAISLFSAISKSSNGVSRAVSGTGSGCATCAATSCATCSN